MSRSPTPKEIKDLRERHDLTQVQLAESLYGIRVQNVANWESGRRRCQPIVWWAMKLTWDEEDIFNE